MYFSEEFIRRIYRAGFLFVILLLVLDLLAYFYYPETVFGKIFLATREQTPLTWVSAVALLGIALSSLCAYRETRKKIWYFLAIIFFFFSMDDATYFHERVSGAFVDATSMLSFFPSYSWMILYAPLLAFSLGAFVWLAWRGSLIGQRKAIFIAVGLLGFAVLLDFLDGLVWKNSGLVFCFDAVCNGAVVHGMRLTEEVVEVIAFGSMGFAIMREHCRLRES